MKERHREDKCTIKRGHVEKWHQTHRTGRIKNLCEVAHSIQVAVAHAVTDNFVDFPSILSENVLLGSKCEGKRPPISKVISQARTDVPVLWKAFTPNDYVPFCNMKFKHIRKGSFFCSPYDSLQKNFFNKNLDILKIIIKIADKHSPCQCKLSVCILDDQIPSGAKTHHHLHLSYLSCVCKVSR